MMHTNIYASTVFGMLLGCFGWKKYLAVTCADRSCFPLLLGKRCYTVTRMAACDVLYTKSCAKILAGIQIEIAHLPRKPWCLRAPSMLCWWPTSRWAWVGWCLAPYIYIYIFTFVDAKASMMHLPFSGEKNKTCGFEIHHFCWQGGFGCFFYCNECFLPSQDGRTTIFDRKPAILR